jgi:photosystem II stability/assembly factor-like uncharacterized protein
MGVRAVPEPDFIALRLLLEAEAVPPSFGVIRARRSRRTLRTALAAAVVTATLLAGGAAMLAGPGRSTPLPIGTHGPSMPATSGPSTPASPSPGIDPSSDAQGDAATGALAASPSGRLYAISPRGALLRSTDLGATWTAVHQLPIDMSPEPPVLLVADDAHFWVASGPAVIATADGGATWHPQSSQSAGATDSPVSGVTAGGGAWLLGMDAPTPPRARLHYASVQEPAFRSVAAPAGTEPARVVALDTDRALLLAVDDTGTAVWYGTADRGRHWTKLPDPCAGTRFPGSPFSTMSVAPDGSRWAVCVGFPGSGQQRKDLVRSTDGGQSWQNLGALEDNGYADQLYPVSASTAWRTGDRADVYRTTDGGTHWTDVAATGAAGGAPTFFAIDANTAVYFGSSETSDQTLVHLTRDGGRTWTSHPFAP